MIVAGSPELVTRDSGAWAILDIGFARVNPTCGIELPDVKPTCVTFADARDHLRKLVAGKHSAINLVIEAPLSVAFNRAGNPTHRSIERSEGRQRPWYVGLGCSVMVAALYLIRDLAAISDGRPICLFEGFVSFKSRKTRHLNDVAALSAIIDGGRHEDAAVVAAGDLRADSTDVLESAGVLCGIDFGIPPVLLAPAPPPAQ